MPCYDPDADSYTLRKQTETINKLTKLLCEATGLLSYSRFGSIGWSKELREWRLEHNKKDKARKEQERRVAREQQLRKQALAKLAPEEQRALGIR